MLFEADMASLLPAARCQSSLRRWSRCTKLSLRCASQPASCVKLY